MNKQEKLIDNKIAHEMEYVDFLRKRLDSDNFKKNVTEEEYELTKKKLDKAKLRLKFLLDDKNK